MSGKFAPSERKTGNSTCRFFLFPEKVNSYNFPYFRYFINPPAMRSFSIRVQPGIIVILLFLIFPGNPLYAQDFNADMKLAMSLYEKGKYLDAAGIFEKWLPEVKKELGDKDTTTYTNMLSYIGYCYQNAGNYEKALSRFEECADVFKKTNAEQSLGYANALHNLAGVYIAYGNYDRALEIYEEAMDIIIKTSGENNSQYATTLSNMAYIYQKKGDNEKALRMFEEALKITESISGENDPEYATLVNNIGGIYFSTGEYEKAVPMMEKSLQLDKKLLGPDHPGYATSLNNLATVYVQTGRYDKALPLYEESIALMEKTLGKNHPDYITAKYNLAYVYELSGDYEKASELYAEAGSARPATYGGNHPDEASSYNNEANFQKKMGNYDKALLLYEKALQVVEKNYGRQHAEYAYTLNNMAYLYSDLGNIDKAKELYEEALGIIVTKLGKENAMYATTLQNLAGINKSLGNYDLAESSYKECVEIRKAISGDKNPDYAILLINLADLYMLEGNYNDAILLLEEAKTIIRTTIGKDNSVYATILNNLAGLYDGLGKNEQALPLYKEALEINKKNLGINNPDCLPTLHNLASIYHYNKQYDLARPLIEEENTLLNSNIKNNFSFLVPEEKVKYISKINYNFDILYSYILKEKQYYPELTGFAFNDELNHKGMILHSETALQQSILDSGDSSLVRRYEKLRSLKKEIISQQQKPIAERDTTLSRLEEQANDIERGLIRQSKEFALLQSQFSLTWQDVQKQLKPDEAAIEFVNFNEFDGSAWTGNNIYCALVIRQQDQNPGMIYLCEVSELEPALPRPGAESPAINQAYRGDRGGKVKMVAQDSGEPGRKLYDILWKPLDSLLEGIRTIYYAPAGLLHKISFAAISCPDNSLLIDRYNLIQLSSTRSLVIPARNVPIKDAVVFGGIEYDSDTVLQLAEASKYRKEGDADNAIAMNRSSTNSAGFNYLEGTLKEANKVSESLNAHNITTNELTGRKAVEEAFLSLSGNNSPSVIHIATHGFYFPFPVTDLNQEQKFIMTGQDRFIYAEDPLQRSGLALTGANRVMEGLPVPKGLEDGILTAKEVSAMNLSGTQLVVLSACQTGLGDVKGNEGVEGLLRGFKMAGVRYLILSLWEVPDFETEEFMTLFYENWMGGLDIRLAFNTTRHKMKDKYKDDPYKWAAFVLIE